jgi:hypothetical protein
MSGLKTPECFLFWPHDSLYEERLTILINEMHIFLCWDPVADAPECTAAYRLIAQPEILDVPTCTTRCPARHNDASDPSSERWNYWARNGR